MFKNIKNKTVTCAEMKSLEKAADTAGLSYYQMMENAGTAAFHEILKKIPGPIREIRALVLCGKGNNGGDGFVVARLLNESGAHVTVLLTEGCPVTKDAITNFDLLKKQNINIIDMFSSGGNCNDSSPEEKISTEVLSYLKNSHIIIDSIYGTGFRGRLRPSSEALINAVNKSSVEGALIFSLDIPSGLPGDADKDQADFETCIKASFTIVFHAKKPVHNNKTALLTMGSLIVADIGIYDAIRKG